MLSTGPTIGSAFWALVGSPSRGFTTSGYRVQGLILILVQLPILLPLVLLLGEPTRQWLEILLIIILVLEAIKLTITNTSISRPGTPRRSLACWMLSFIWKNAQKWQLPKKICYHDFVLVLVHGRSVLSFWNPCCKKTIFYNNFSRSCVSTQK